MEQEDRFPKYVDDLFVFLSLRQKWTLENNNMNPQLPGFTREQLLDIVHIWHSFFDSNPAKKIILGCGDCRVSQFLSGMVMCKKWITTDIKIRSSENIRYLQYDAVDSVLNYGRTCNVLVLITPLSHEVPAFRPAFGSSVLVDDTPPHYCGMSDYYASKMFIEQTLETKIRKWIVFIGGLGITSGTRGMHHFYMTHPNLRLQKKHENLFIFEILSEEEINKKKCL